MSGVREPIRGQPIHHTTADLVQTTSISLLHYLSVKDTEMIPSTRTLNIAFETLAENSFRAGITYT